MHQNKRFGEGPFAEGTLAAGNLAVGLSECFLWVHLSQIHLPWEHLTREDCLWEYMPQEDLRFNLMVCHGKVCSGEI